MATLTSQYCTPEERTLSARPNAPLHCFTRNESIALAVCTPYPIQTALAGVADFEKVLGAVGCIVTRSLSRDVPADRGGCTWCLLSQT